MGSANTSDSICLRFRAITPSGKSGNRFRRGRRCISISRRRTGFVTRAPAVARVASSSSANAATLTSRSAARATSGNTTGSGSPIGSSAQRPARGAGEARAGGRVGRACDERINEGAIRQVCTSGRSRRSGAITSVLIGRRASHRRRRLQIRSCTAWWGAHHENQYCSHGSDRTKARAAGVPGRSGRAVPAHWTTGRPAIS